MDESEISKTIFWWALFFAFWLTCAIVLGYAFGYRLNLQRGVFVYGGSITIKSTPQNADVYINGVLYSSKSLNRLNNSYHIGGIAPGTYMLEVKSPGYATWQKNIAVHSGISTEFWNVILTKTSYQQTAYDTSGVQRFFISPRQNVTAVAEQNADIFSVNIVTAANKTSVNVFSANDYSFTTNDKENIEWTPEAKKIIIPSMRNTDHQEDYFIVDVSTKDTQKLSDIVHTTDLSHVRWDPNTENALFYMSGGNLFRINLDSPDQIQPIAQDISGYELSSSGLYYFQLPEGIVYKTSFDGTATPTQITRNAPDMTDPTYQIIAYDDDRMTFLNSSGDLYVYNNGEKDDYFQQLSSDALGSQFSDDGKKLLYWSNHEVDAYFLRDWDVQPVRSENDILPVATMVDTISNVQWYRDYEHVLLDVDNKLKLIELDQRDHRNIMDIASLNSGDAKIVNNNADGLVYFSDTDSGSDNMTLRTIEFPEKTTLLQNLGFGGGTQTPATPTPAQ